MTSIKRPNFLMIVADDLGFSDTGPYGSEISTPSLDRLAKDGLRMTDFHTAPACSPTRAMLMSGTDNHVAGLGQMAEFMATNAEAFQGHPGYEGYLNFRIAALPEILQDEGYFTAMSGKWHLGLKPEHAPSARGFTKSLALLPGAGNHFNYEPDFDPDLNYPSFMKSDGLWMEGDRVIDRSSEFPDDFYSTNYFTDRLLQFLDERTPDEAEQPFFAYLAYTAPHWPLQAPQNIVEKYRGQYSDGPDELRTRRLEQLRSLGLMPEDAIPAPVNSSTTEWQNLSASEQADSARRMEVYAAMVDAMDQNIGRVLDRLEDTGELDNTFVVFMSDNGAEGALLEAIPVMRSIGLLSAIEKHFDNSTDNLGNPTSFFWYGPRWASAATAPSRGFKGFTTEGGIRCPCIVRYPALQRGTQQISHDFTTVMGILPTCLELAGIQPPGKTFRGREIAPIRGKSWVPYLSGEKKSVYDADLDVTGWELFGLRGIRRGNFKAVLIPPPRGSGEWELYNVAKDPGEIEDLAEMEKGILNELLTEWENYFAETGMFEFDVKNRSVKGV
ncbi:putative arylsulfatase [Ilyonectria destructans]|nr:putative arylsulfatase [Ilyonectria destructans]